MNSILIVNTEDEETYGAVWHFDLGADFDIAPMINPKNGKLMNFLDWFEYWVDKILELSDDEYFSYGEFVGY